MDAKKQEYSYFCPADAERIAIDKTLNAGKIPMHCFYLFSKFDSNQLVIFSGIIIISNDALPSGCSLKAGQNQLLFDSTICCCCFSNDTNGTLLFLFQNQSCNICFFRLWNYRWLEFRMRIPPLGSLLLLLISPHPHATSVDLTRLSFLSFHSFFTSLFFCLFLCVIGHAGCALVWRHYWNCTTRPTFFFPARFPLLLLFFFFYFYLKKDFVFASNSWKRRLLFFSLSISLGSAIHRGWANDPLSILGWFA